MDAGEDGRLRRALPMPGRTSAALFAGIRRREAQSGNTYGVLSGRRPLIKGFLGVL